MVDYDHRELENVLRARGVQNDCPSCGDPDLAWQYTSALLLRGVNADGTPGESFWMAGMICPQCGYTRLYALNTLGVAVTES